MRTFQSTQAAVAPAELSDEQLYKVAEVNANLWIRAR
jgi:hypothetical protein